MDKKMLKMAAAVMKVSSDDERIRYKKIPEIDAYYFWLPVRGGTPVIINSNYEKLGASSAVPYDKHLEAFISGKRN